MSAPPLLNTFEGGTDETLITTGNSGGASGNAFDAVTSGTTTLTFDTARAKSGSFSMRVDSAASPVVGHADWTGLGSLTSSVYFRSYVYMATQDGSANDYFFRAQTAASGACAKFAIGPLGIVRAYDASETEIAAAQGTVAISIGSWARLEWRVLASTTVGQVEWRLFNSPDAATPTETKQATGLVLGANLDKCQFGIVDTTAPASYTKWMDDLAVSTGGWIGPNPPALPLPVHLPFMS